MICRQLGMQRRGVMRVAILAAPAAPARRGCTQRCEITLAASCWRAPFWLKARLAIESSKLRTTFCYVFSLLGARKWKLVPTTGWYRAREGVSSAWFLADLWLWTDLLLTYTSCIRPSLFCHCSTLRCGEFIRCAPRSYSHGRYVLSHVTTCHHPRHALLCPHALPCL
jgi:hypothetical protein